MIDRTQFHNALQITLARIGQPILAFGIMQAYLQSDGMAPVLFPVLWGLAHTVFVFFLGLIISAQNYAVQRQGTARQAVFAHIAVRVVATSLAAALICGAFASTLFGIGGWGFLLGLYLVSSVLNAAHNTLHELAGRRIRSIAVNWIWISTLIVAVASFGIANIAPLTLVIAIILFRIVVVIVSIATILRGVALFGEATQLRERMKHGAEIGFNMAAETAAFPILTYTALLIGGHTAAESIYTFSVEANFLFTAMTGVLQQATLHFGAHIGNVRGHPRVRDFIRDNILHVLGSAVVVVGAGVVVLALVGESQTPAYWALVYGAVLVMAIQTLAVSWARVLDLTRMITLTALPSTFAVFVGSTLLFLWVGVAPRLAITLGVVIDGALIAALLLWLVQRTLCQEVPDLRPGRCIAGLESIKEEAD